MSEPFIGEIRIFGFKYAPRGWALCQGQLMDIRQSSALFAILGVNYGGNGTTNFALPNLQGNAAMDYGSGVGLTPHTLGERGGSPTVTLNMLEMAAHNHLIQTINDDADLAMPDASAGMAKSQNANFYNTQLSAGGGGAMAANMLGFVGGNQPHNNMQPYLPMNFCIALQGIYPPRH